MHDFHYQGDELFCEETPIRQITEQVGTPCYIYSHRTLIRHFQAFDQAFKAIPHIVAFAMKSNSNLTVLRLLAKEGSGADIVSGGELFRALTAGMAPDKIVFPGSANLRKKFDMHCNRKFSCSTLNLPVNCNRSMR